MIFQELDKLKTSSIMASIILMTVGIVMIICPVQYVDSLVCVLGYGLLIFAIVGILEFMSSKRDVNSYIALTCSLIMALLGIIVLTFDNVIFTIGLVFGLILIGDGIFGIANSLLYLRRAQRKGWWVVIVFNALMIFCGISLLINPLWKDPASLTNAIGCMLVFSSIVGILRLIYLWPIKSE